MATFPQYGLLWEMNTRRLDVEMYMIRKGGQWQENGKTVGKGLYHHYREMQKLLWPEDDQHRWSDLALNRMVEYEITIFCGASDSSKTYSMSKFILCDWWCHPDNTLWLVSSTDRIGAEMRIWGAIKQLFNRGRRRYPDLAGYVLESIKAIVTDAIDDEQSEARAINRGLVLVPCKRGTTFVGLSSYVGIKAPRLRHAGDEVQLMSAGFADSYSNWYGKPDFKGIMAGNPLEITDQLCTLAEPVGGWDGWTDTKKTQEWTSTFFNAHVVSFDGRDSPNFDVPSARDKYPYLIGKKKFDGVSKTYGDDNWRTWSQCIGKPNRSIALYRVITRQICRQHKALEKVEWEDLNHIEILALDPAYGGGCRCVLRRGVIGHSSSGKQILQLCGYEIVPIKLSIDVDPEDQIARYVHQRSIQLGIPPENIFYDSTGKGTLGFAFSQHFKQGVPVAIDSGGPATSRPVRFDLFVDDTQERDKHGDAPLKRLKRCDEHYSKFVTEMWFSTREAIESEQVRELDNETMDEGCKRIYKVVKGDRIEIEPKDDYIERTGESPDLYDDFSILVEGARRRGFKINRIGVEPTKPQEKTWFEIEAEECDDIIQSKLLTHR